MFWLLPLSLPSSSFTSIERERGRAPTRKAYIPTGESVVPDGCLWTLMNHDLSTTPATTELCRILPHSHTTHRLPQVQTTCDTPERIFRTRTSSHLVLDLHPRPVGQKRRKLVPSGNPDTLCTPMWRTPYQKTTARMSLNFRQRTANEEGRCRHPWRDLPFIPTTNHHRQEVRQRSSDRRSGYPDCFFSFALCV